MRVWIVTLLLLISFAAPQFEARADDEEEQTTKHDVKKDDLAIHRLVDNFFNALRKRDLSTAYNTYTAPEFQAKTDYNAFQSVVGEFASLKRNGAYAIKEITYSEDSAVILLEISSLEHKGNRLLVKVRFRDGQWRILGLQVYAPA